MVYIPAGDFQMGSRGGEDDERPVHQVQVDAFWIDQFEITNSAFERFVLETGYQTDAEKTGGGSLWQNSQWNRVAGLNWRQPNSANEGIATIMDHPVVQVSWNDALAYCQWAGGRLPSEAEWELAAIGTTGRKYPWGNQLDSTRLNASGQGTVHVGSYETGKSPCGAYDMAGNVWEWVNDWYQSDYYSSSPVTNPKGPKTGTQKVLRGGAFDPSGGDSRSADRGALPPGSQGNTIGFRCAMDAATTPPPTAIPTTELQGKIAFATDRYGYSEICTIRTDGSHLKRLTSNQVYDWHPNWSPDGTRLVFVTNRDGPGTDEIYLMNADGSNSVRLSRNPIKDDTPTWHPKGERIFFSSLRDGNWELYSMRTDGSDVKRLTNHPALDQFPTISPDGQQMAFASERDGNRELYVANVDGTDIRRLTNRSEEDWAPDWSPRGDWIAFASKVGEDEWALFLIQPDGSGLARLTYNGGEYPAWSPDGAKIVFLAFRQGNGRLYVIDADGSNEQEITHTSNIDWSPAWSR